ncbi:hypothetical protein FKG94_00025 [Exilibacterium tricleocarpae]|uniref:Uncharacterized protein n=1 Tax=Exilibacterium tricleocarpae TaxID=2591008 RepID=A0A545UBC8_9GAMM|nr:hypothetical protein [Exilibacterium tricleocarpae]TQV86770.1 hypothetical protein FKG94_00025 [Exilibacterium tricleocarpae]
MCKSTKVAILLFLIALANIAQADSYQVVDYVRYSGTVSYSNAGRFFSYTDVSNDYASIVNRAADVQAMEGELRAQLRAAIQEEINGKLSLRNYNFRINGPITLALYGEQDGTISVRFGGFTVYASARLRKNILAEAEVSFSSTPIWLNGSYDISSGAIYNVYADPSLRVDVHVDVDSILDLIPLFNAIVTNKLEDSLEAEAEAAIYERINALSGYETVVFGLDTEIPDNVYVFEGRDLGREVKDGLLDIVSGESLTITLEETPVYYVGLYGPLFYDVDTVTINISEHLEFSFTEQPFFRWRTDCPINRPCELPDH